MVKLIADGSRQLCVSSKKDSLFIKMIFIYQNITVINPTINPGCQLRSHKRMEFKGNIISRQHSILRFNCFMCFSYNNMSIYQLPKLNLAVIDFSITRTHIIIHTRARTYVHTPLTTKKHIAAPKERYTEREREGGEKTR